MSITDHFEFLRRSDGLSYRFEPSDSRGGYPAWKRIDADLWLVWMPKSGWCVIDALGDISSRPWNVEVAEQGDAPPECEWVSKKGENSYVYTLVRFGGPGQR